MAQTLRERVRKREVEAGARPGITRDQRERVQAKIDETLLLKIHQVWQANIPVYGADKVWHQLNWQCVAVAPCVVVRRQGCQDVAFVMDVYACRIVGWRQSSSMRPDFVLDALEQALYARQPEHTDALIHHSDIGSK